MPIGTKLPPCLDKRIIQDGAAAIGQGGLDHRLHLHSGDETEYLWAYIRRLRRKIEPDASNPRYILTQPGVGYYFVAPA
ncbi:hypothetical protein SE17_05030 [Kouleothrix aurantiaca]|jgi:hypothetical protein|uniref:OmpR/PhoB-type domain-containing protein n=1 Tax=Kouleothrix aurantiaca TaxID=186479 RepID=A0A0P9DL28_9CHLR|nr:hypothetical protein SE17_05030 [Kouleothrix aurantiaca]